ncbi:hypothetical protein Q7P35_007044 [Cladosporium inversicolor]
MPCSLPGRVELKHIHLLLASPSLLLRQETRLVGDSSVAFTLKSKGAHLRHLSDTSQSTLDRTRYICTPRSSLPMSNAPLREARDSQSKCSLPMKLNPLFAPRHPALAAVTTPIVPLTRRVRELANNLSAASPRPLRVPATRPLTTVVQHQTGPWSICCAVALTMKPALTCAYM